MILVNSEKIFEQAMQTQNVETIEKILLSSDRLNELIQNFCKNNEIDQLVTMSKSFKSKGLVRTILNLIEKYRFYSNKEKENNACQTIKLTHNTNKEKNENRYLSETIFAVRMANEREKKLIEKYN